mmetsp:Transcript_38330/g.28228  ORF Transcript_38330/g.28228 Transcript_38330/m.28228 type:complete len:90 (-) Transcript_38330:476-745(-)
MKKLNEDFQRIRFESLEARRLMEQDKFEDIQKKDDSQEEEKVDFKQSNMELNLSDFMEKREFDEMTDSILFFEESLDDSSSPADPKSLC